MHIYLGDTLVKHQDITADLRITIFIQLCKSDQIDVYNSYYYDISHHSTSGLEDIVPFANWSDTGNKSSKYLYKSALFYVSSSLLLNSIDVDSLLQMFAQARSIATKLL
jgi:hypothetical protein